ncbi:MAG: TonB-dependent receptor [Chitinophagales bacterium]|nr:MAG: TonB-dependent receptor [Chitinophagales bacterium]
MIVNNALAKSLFRLVFHGMFLGILFMTSYPVCAQTIRVLSATDKTPVPFAHILIKPLDADKENRNLVLYTDSAGIAVIPDHYWPSMGVISVSCIGYIGVKDTIPFSEDHTYYLRMQKQFLNEVIITAQYQPQRAEQSTPKVHVIDKTRITQMAAVTLLDVLNYELNMRLSHDPVLGTRLDLQGISGDNVKILIDGVPVVGRQNGFTDLSQINLHNVERIEIIEGPLSVNYGTNALAGTVNLITQKTVSGRLETEVSGYYETSGRYNADAHIGFNKGNHSLALSGGRNFFDGWSPGDRISLDMKPQPADSSRYKTWKPKEQYFAELHYTYSRKRYNFHYRGAYFQELIHDRGKPRGPYGENAIDGKYTTRRTDHTLSFQSDLKKDRVVQVLFAYNHYYHLKNLYYKDLTTLQEVLSPNPGDQDTTRIDLINSRGTFGKSKNLDKLNYETGYDFNIETGWGQRLEDGKKQIGDYAFFVSAEFSPANQVTIRPGLRYGYNTAFVYRPIPSLHLKWNIPIRHEGQSLIIRTSYAYGYKAPTLKELYLNFIDANHHITGNPDLREQYSHNFTFSTTYTGIFSALMMRMEGGLTFNDVRDQIALVPRTLTEYTYENIEQYKTLVLSYHTEWRIHALSLSAGASYLGTYNEESRTHDVPTFSFSPEINASLSYTFEKIGLTTSVFYKYTGKALGYALNDTGADRILYQTFTDAYHKADFTCAKLFWEKRIRLTAGVKNIFDVKNVRSTQTDLTVHSSAATSLPAGTGRTYFLGLDFKLSVK